MRMKSKCSRVKLQSYHGLLGDLNLSPPQYSPPPRSIPMAGYGEGYMRLCPYNIHYKAQCLVSVQKMPVMMMVMTMVLMMILPPETKKLLLE